MVFVKFVGKLSQHRDIFNYSSKIFTSRLCVLLQHQITNNMLLYIRDQGKIEIPCHIYSSMDQL